MRRLLNRLVKDFSDKEFAHAYMESHSVSRVAAQIHALRKKFGWSQEKLAERAGLAQERVSKIESADFDSLTIKTLRKFSRAYDVNLRIAFEPFSEGIMDVVNLDPHRLAVESREKDLAHFCQLSYQLDGDGNWVTTESKPRLTVFKETIAPTKEWQEIGSGQSVGLPAQKVA